MRAQWAILAACLGFLHTGSAAAADMPPAQAPRPYTAPVVPAPYNWSGVYLGANGGYAWGTGAAAAVLTGNPFLFEIRTTAGSMDGAFAGGQIGANWQTGLLVLGVEADGQFSWQRAVVNGSCGFPCTTVDTYRSPFFGTLRTRVGVAVDRFLIYSTGGLAVVNLTDQIDVKSGPVGGPINVSMTKLGFAVGGGMEFGITDYVSAKIEYLFVQASGFAGSGAVPLVLGGGTVTEAANFQDQIIRAGINIRMPMGSGVSARY